MEWQRTFDRLSFHEFHSDGFSVGIHNPPEGMIVRYSEGDRALTLLASIVDETKRLGRRWFLFRKFLVILHVPSLLKWDNGIPLTQVEAILVLDRIRTAVPSRGSRYRVAIDDAFYLALQRDVDAAQN